MPDPQNQNAYQQLQRIYEDLSQRGILRDNPQAQALGHILRQSGLIYDPTQGGVVSLPRTSGGMGELRKAEAADDRAHTVAASLDPTVLQKILNELGRFRANDNLNRSARDLNIPVAMRPNGTLQAHPEAVESQAQQRIQQALAVDAQRRTLQQQAAQLQSRAQAEANKRPPVSDTYYRQIPLESQLASAASGAPQQPQSEEAARAFLQQGGVTRSQTPPPIERLPQNQSRLTPLQSQLADVQSQLAKLGPDSPVNSFDAAVGEASRRFLQTLAPGAFSTDPEREALLNRLSFWHSIAAQPEAKSGFDFVFPGSTQVAAETPGVLGAARELALGVASPSNAAITGATLGANALLAIPETLAALRSAQAETAFTDVANTTADLVAARNAGDAAQQAILQPLAETKYGVFDGLRNQANAYQSLAYRLAPLRTVSNDALKYYYAAHGAAGAEAAAANTDLLAQDPVKYWANVGGQAALASAPFVMPHALTALDTLIQRARQFQSPSGAEAAPTGSELTSFGSAPASMGGGSPAPFSPSGLSPLALALRPNSTGSSPSPWSPFPTSGESGFPASTNRPIAPLASLATKSAQAQGFPGFQELHAFLTGASPSSPAEAGFPRLSEMNSGPALARPANALAALSGVPSVSGASSAPVITADTLPLFVRQALAQYADPARNGGLANRATMPMLSSGNEAARLLPPAPASQALLAQSGISATPALASVNPSVPTLPTSALQTLHPARIDPASAPLLSANVPLPVQNASLANQASNPVLPSVASSNKGTAIAAGSALNTASQTPGPLQPGPVSDEKLLSPSIVDRRVAPIQTEPMPIPMNQTMASAANAIASSQSASLPATRQTPAGQPARTATAQPQRGDWVAMPNGDRYLVEDTSLPQYTLARSEADGNLTKLPASALTPVAFEPTHSLVTA